MIASADIIDTLGNLLDLIKKSPMEAELLNEMLNIISSHIPEADHTIFGMDNKGLKILTSTLSVQATDERTFLEKLVRNHYAEEQSLADLKITSVRRGIEKMAAHPLFFCGQVKGLWIIEYPWYPQKKSNHEKLLVKTVGIILGVYYNNKEAKWNLYLDPVTKLPGKYYFSMILESLKKRNGTGNLCVIRVPNLDQGYYKNIEQIKELGELLRDLHFGMVYRIDENTFVIIVTNWDKVKAFDMLSEFLETNKERGLKGALLPIRSPEIFFEEMEVALSHCNIGSAGFILQKQTDKQPGVLKEG